MKKINEKQISNRKRTNEFRISKINGDVL